MASKKMTLAQAVKFVKEARGIPLVDIDRVKLIEAVQVIAAEAQRSFVEKGSRQIRELPTDLSDTLGEVKLGSDKPFLEGAGNVIDDAFAAAADLVRRVFASTPQAPEAEAGSERGPGPGREGEPLGPGRLRGGGNPRSRLAAQRASALPRVSAGLLDRLDKAAERAGVGPDRVQEVIEVAQQAASGSVVAPDGTVIPAPPGFAPEFSVEQLLEGQIAEWMDGTIGGIQFAQREQEIPAGEGLERFRRERGISPTVRLGEVAARYFIGDQGSYAGLPTEDIAKIQQRLVNAGLMEPDGYYPGVWDMSVDGEAMLIAMENANASGLTVDEVLDSMIANLPQSVKDARNAAKLARQFQAPAFIKLDPATASQRVKRMMRQELGREPSDQEMAELTGAMSSVYRSDYEAEVAAMRSEFDAEQQGLATGVAVTPAAVADVDPEARMWEQFDARFGPELEFIEGQQDTVRNAQNVFASLTSMGRLVG